MARDTAAIGTDVVIGSNTPDVETTVEALIRAYNRLPLNTNLTTGDRMEWDGTNWVPVGKDTSFVRKTANETVNNSASVQADDELTLAVSASQVYEFEAFIVYSAAATADLRLQWNVPTGATLSWMLGGLATSTGSVNGDMYAGVRAAGDQVGAGGAGAGTKVGASVRGLLVVGGTAGSLALSWAQITAEASDTIIYADSYMKLRQVS